MEDSKTADKHKVDTGWVERALGDVFKYGDDGRICSSNPQLLVQQINERIQEAYEAGLASNQRESVLKAREWAVEQAHLLLADFARQERLDEAEQWEKHGFLQLDGKWCRERLAELRSAEGERG